MVRLLILLSVLTLLLTDCVNQSEKKADSSAQKDSLVHQRISRESVAGNFSRQAILLLGNAEIGDFFQRYPEFRNLKADLEKFYAGRANTYAWFDESGAIEQIYSLHYHISHLQDEGLSGSIPYMKQIDALMDDNDSSITKEKANPEAELLLTSAYFSYARLAWQGLTEKETKQLDWFLPRKKLNLPVLMDSLLKEGSGLPDAAPVYRQYPLFKSYLKKYREIELAGGWPLIKPEKKTLKQEDSLPSVATLRKRLFITGDLAGDTSSLKFDSALVSAVKNFQLRHGLAEDGAVGPSVITALNIPVSTRIKQLVINMERCRWIPTHLRNTNIVINIPAYKLHVYENDSLAWSMNVVVGEALNKTVIFHGDLKYVVFSPYWNVPPGIMKKEILPGIRRDPGYLKKHNMEWNGRAIRQKPGPGNSLGKVKFLFPNSFNIYLHDTPAKALFSKDKRAFSHGCIRLAEPKKLAMYLLKDMQEWTEDKITKAMDQEKEQYVTLRQTVPVYIAYFTSWIDWDGRINFRQDIYDRDEKLAKLILNE